ncbi:MAG: hypothetical protein IKT00_00375, partial [Prevotella sp.]|nr:hypothetical protein [Prevotella sp.]
PRKCVPLFMLLMFCRKNKGNKKGRVPSEELGLNSYFAQKVLADTNNYFYNSIGNESDISLSLFL